MKIREIHSKTILSTSQVFDYVINSYVGLSITSANDEMRKVFEPDAPPIMDRLRTIESLHRNGIKTFVTIADDCRKLGIEYRSV